MKHTGYELLRYAANSRGLNTRDTITNIDSGYARALLNVEFDLTGAISKRNGHTKINSTAIASAPSFVGLTQYDTLAGLKFAFGVVADTQKIYKMDDLDGTWDDITGAAVVSTGDTSYWNFAIGLDTLIGANSAGSDVPIKFTGAGNAAALSISQFTHAKRVAYYKNRAVFFNTKETTWRPGRIRWSDADTIETYTAANYLDESGSSDGSEITGVGQLLDDIYIFKDSLHNGIKRLFYVGSDLLTFSIINIGEVGTVAGDSVVQVDLPNVGPVLMYWGMDNKIRVFDGGASYPISDLIQPTLDGLNTAKNANIHAVNYKKKNQVWFFCNAVGSATHNYVIVFDYKNNAWLIFDNITANRSAILTDTSELEVLVTGNYAGLAFTMDSGTSDNAANFNSYWKSAWQPLGNPSITKRARWMDVYAAKSGDWDVTIKWSFNFDDTSTESTTINVNQLNPHKGVDLLDYGNTKYISVEFHQNVKDEPFTIYEYDIWAKALGVKNV